MDGIDSESLPDEEIAAAGAVGASVIKDWFTVARCGLVWLMALLIGMAMIATR